MDQWNDYETVLLIETYFLIKDNQISKKDGLSLLSYNLRKMALNSGTDISDRYRNINGMTWQYSIMDYLVTKKEINREAPQIFKKCLNIFYNEKENYIKLLQEAKKRVRGGSDMNDNKLIIDILDCLNNYYTFGIRVNSPIEIIRFRNNFAKHYDYNINITDSEIYEIFSENCIISNSKAYYFDKETLNCLGNIIDKYKQKFVIIYYDELYNIIYKDLEKIISSEVLEEILRKYFKEYCYRKNYLLLNSDYKTELDAIDHDIKAVWGENVLQNVYYLEDKISMVSVEKIKYALSYSDSFVWNSEDTYAAIKSFICNEENKQKILQFAKDSCDNIGYFNYNDLSIDDIYEDNYEMSKTAVYSCIMKTILVDYDKVDKVIKKKGSARSQGELLTEYCLQRKNVTLDELENYQNKETGSIRLDVILDVAYSKMIRIDENNFVGLNSISFDVYHIDKSISDYFKDKSIGLKEILSFSSFPECGVAWNYYLLESYLMHFSILFKHCTSISNSSNVGAIVRKNMNYDYFELLVDAVSRLKCPLEKDVIYEELVKKGYLRKKYYKRIDELIENVRKIKK